MSAPKTASTASEARAIQTNEVNLILTLEDLDRSLAMLKTNLLVSGENEHAQAFKESSTTKWNLMFRLLYNPQKIIPRTVKEPFLRLACHISNIMT
jgi:hypothetical protein